MEGPVLGGTFEFSTVSKATIIFLKRHELEIA